MNHYALNRKHVNIYFYEIKGANGHRVLEKELLDNLNHWLILKLKNTVL